MSSATVHADCRKACRAQLITCPGLPAEKDRAWEGIAYKPTGVPFIEDKLVATRGLPVAIGAIDHGISYIITLKFPANQGTKAIEALGGALLDLFRVGTKLTANGQTFLCYKAERRGAIVQEVDWQVLTVVVDLQTFTTE